MTGLVALTTSTCGQTCRFSVCQNGYCPGDRRPLRCCLALKPTELRICVSVQITYDGVQVITKLIEELPTTQLFLLQRQGPMSFLLCEDGAECHHKVLLGQQPTCSCRCSSDALLKVISRLCYSTGQLPLHLQERQRNGAVHPPHICHASCAQAFPHQPSNLAAVLDRCSPGCWQLIRLNGSRFM